MTNGVELSLAVDRLAGSVTDVERAPEALNACSGCQSCIARVPSATAVVACTGSHCGRHLAGDWPCSLVSSSRISYRIDIVDVVGAYLYRPSAVALIVAVRTAKRLQSCRLDAYLAYMVITLVAVLAVVTAQSRGNRPTDLLFKARCGPLPAAQLWTSQNSPERSPRPGCL